MHFSIRVASAFALFTASHACSSSSGLLSAVSDIVSSALQCKSEAISRGVQLDGVVASACNQAQSTYASMNYAQIAALAGRCYCVDAYYNKAKTIGDVGRWVVCVSPWNTLAVTNGKAIVDFENTHPDVFATCNVCTDSKFPTLDPKLEQIKTVLEFVMDWRDKLRESEIELLKEGIQAVVTSAVLGNGVPGGAQSPTADWITSLITKGQPSSSGSLQPRQDNSTNATSPLISQLIGVEVTLRMVPVNATTSTLQDRLKKALEGTDFASNLTAWNANLTSATYSTVYGNGSMSTTSSPSGTAAASPSSTKSIASLLLPAIPSVLLGIIVSVLAMS